MTTQSQKPWPTLTTEEEFRFLTDLVFKHRSADNVFLTLHDHNSGTTRFANNQIIQNVNTRKVTVNITAAFGQKHGTASTTDLTAGSVQDTLKQSERIANQSPEDPEFLPPIGPQTYSARTTSHHNTVASGPAERLTLVKQAIEHCQKKHFNSAGIIASSTIHVGVAANTGLFGHEQRTEARFSLTAQQAEATGWTAALHRSIQNLNVETRTHEAIKKASLGRNPQEIPPGRYTVILEPAAVAGLLTWLMRMLDAKSHDKGTSAFNGKLEKQIIDQRLTLRNRPDHPDLLGQGFTSEGLPIHEATWIARGILKQLSFDRFTAKQHGIDQIPTLESPYLSAESARSSNVNDLIRDTNRGILVTNFWYIRPVNPTDLTLTGMTRDGTFLIEDGQITTPIRNFRFHDSPLRVFNQIESLTDPQEATSSETGKLLVPAMKIRDFNLSSVTRF